MDAQEAIDELEKQIGMMDDGYLPYANYEANKTAIVAIEKQSPVKPKPYKGWEGQCPDCGVVFVDRLTKFCGNCGKALCWED